MVRVHAPGGGKLSVFPAAADIIRSRGPPLKSHDDQDWQDDQPLEEQDEYDWDGPSKSALKRESHELQKLGETLAGLSPARLKSLPLPDELRRAIADLQSIRSRGAGRRQRQFIGKVMRSIDAEPIRTALEAMENQSLQERKHFHDIERWRDRFVEDGEAAATEFIDRYPGTDRQQLRSLLRNLATAKTEDKRTRAARVLFKFLRQVMGSGPVQANNGN